MATNKDDRGGGRSVNEDYARRIVASQVQINRMEAGTAETVRGTLSELSNELVKKLIEMDLEGVSHATFKFARAEKLLAQTNATIAAAYQQVVKGVTGTLSDIATYTKESLERADQAVMGGSVMTTALTPQDLRSIAKNLIVDGNPAKTWWARQQEGTRVAYAREVRKGLAAGETTGDIVRRVRGRDTGLRQVVEVGGVRRVLTKFVGGVMDVPTRQAEALVRSSVQAVSNDVLTETYKANKTLLNGQQLLATLDLRTCPLCMGLDGGAWEVESPYTVLKSSVVQAPYPGDLPLHINCRCVWIPVVKSWEQLIKEAGGKVPRKLTEVPESTRASMDGQVSGTMTYDEWLRGQPQEAQIEALGQGKWQLWKDGKITDLRQLVDQSGNVLSLKDLKASIAPPPAVPKDNTTVPVSDYGMEYDAKNVEVVARARMVKDELWDTLPISSIPRGTVLQANEEVVKKRHIDKVVSGAEPFREGYTAKLWRDADGNLHVVDGHTRAAMYDALGLPLPARVMDEAKYNKLQVPVDPNEGHPDWTSQPYPPSQHQPIATFEELISRAGEVKTDFDGVNEQILKKIGGRVVTGNADMPGSTAYDAGKDAYEGRFTETLLVAAPNKDPKSALKKINSDYRPFPDQPLGPGNMGDPSLLTDNVRSSFVVKSRAEVDSLLPKLATEYKAAGWEVIKIKDRFFKPLPNGYSDVLLLVKSPSGYITELQIHVAPMWGAKGVGGGHKLYDAWKDADARGDEAAREAANAAMVELYGNAMKKAP